jgi:Ca-activated chloride channel family protein
MSFGSPYLLLSLLLIPIALGVYVLIERRRVRRSTVWSNPSLLPNMVGRRPRRLRYVPAALFLIAFASLLVGFARPRERLGGQKQQAATVVLAFDVSGSMAANDVGAPRIAAAHRIAEQLVRGLPPGDRVAIVSFGQNVRLLQGPTLDRAAALRALPRAITPRSGTRIGNGIEAALSVVVEAVGKSYPGSPVHPGSIVLFSDGAQTAGGPLPSEAANTAFVDGIPIDTIAIGTASGTVTQTTRAAGQSATATIAVPVYPADLTGAAKTSGGISYLVASSADVGKAASGLVGSYRQLSATEIPTQRVRELSTVTVWIALALVLIAVFVAATWFGAAA